MTERTVLIAGAQGQLGRAATKAFLAAGWQVRQFARGYPENRIGSDRVVGDARNAWALAEAAKGCAVILNAVNPDRYDYARHAPVLANSIIAAAKASGAGLILPSGLHVLGSRPDGHLNASTPLRTEAPHGLVHAKVDHQYANACQDGIRACIVRSGDFFGDDCARGLLETHILAGVGRGRLSYPGRTDQLHAWAYVPDLARYLVLVAQAVGSWQGLHQVGYPGETLTGQKLADHVSRILGRPVRVVRTPRAAIRLLGFVSQRYRLLAQNAPAWECPYAIDGSGLFTFGHLPDPTPLQSSLRLALDNRARPAPASPLRRAHQGI